MILFFVLLFFADPEPFEPDAINATLFMKDGKKIELADVRVKDLNPYSISFDVKGKSIRLDLFRIVTIKTLRNSREVEILFNDGTQMTGRISAFYLTGRPVSDPEEDHQFQIREVERVHFISGAQLRSCFNGHYEKRTPHPFCPVCGNLLDIGPYNEEVTDKDEGVLPTHRERVSGRN